MTRALLVAAGVLAGGIVHAEPRPAPAATAAPAQGDPDLSAAVGEHRRVVGILELRIEGMPDEVKESFQRGIEQQLDSRRYWLVGRARMKQLMLRSTRWTEGCFVGKCLTEVKAQTGADLVLLAALTGAGTSFGYVVTLVRTDTGQVVQQAADRCDVCTVSEATSKATQAAVGVVATAPELPDGGAGLGERVDHARQAASSHDRHAAHVGIALTAVGLATAAGGLALYLTQGRPSYAALTAVGGGGLAAGGLVVLAF